MAGSHAHDRHALDRVRIPTRSRVVVLGSLALVALVTLIGLVRLWPESSAVEQAGADVEFAAPGVTFPHAEITAIQPSCDPADQGAAGSESSCGQVEVTLVSGPDEGLDVGLQVFSPIAGAGLTEGDTVQLMRIPQPKGEPALYSFFGVDRTSSLAWMTGLFVLVVLVVARLRGLMALFGLGFSGLVLVKFMLPSLLTGESGIAVALVGASTIMFVVLYLAHGPSMRTSTALAGTLVGIAITAAVAHSAVGGNRLSGVSDETGALLSTLVGQLNFQGLLSCAIIVAGLGVLNDVTITQSSAVWELRAAGPDLTRSTLYRSAMRIGRDHIASTIYTIVFAYAGAALSVLLVLFLYDRPVLDLLGTEDIAAEVVRTLASAIGLVLAVPVTTAIAALTVSAPDLDQPTAPVPRLAGQGQSGVG